MNMEVFFYELSIRDLPVKRLGTKESTMKRAQLYGANFSMYLTRKYNQNEPLKQFHN
jgi:hypothetical protein